MVEDSTSEGAANPAHSKSVRGSRSVLMFPRAPDPFLRRRGSTDPQPAKTLLPIFETEELGREHVGALGIGLFAHRPGIPARTERFPAWSLPRWSLVGATRPVQQATRPTFFVFDPGRHSRPIGVLRLDSIALSDFAAGLWSTIDGTQKPWTFARAKSPIGAGSPETKSSR